jgi:hypothetical protein
MPAPVEAAFGQDVAAANARMAGTVSSLGEKLASHMIERQAKDDERQVFDTAVKFNQEMQDRLYDQTRDDKGKPKGFMLRQLDQTKDSTPEFDQFYHQDLKQKYLDTVTSDAQKTMLQREMDTRFTATRDQIIKHEVTQTNEAFNKSAATFVKTSVDLSAGITDPSILKAAIAHTQEYQALALQRNGLTPDEIAQSSKEVAGEMAKAAVLAVIEQNPKAARSLLENTKTVMSEHQAVDLEKTVKGKEFADKQVAVFNTVSGFKLEDGTPDFAKMESTILSMKDTPTAEKEKLWDYSKARAGEMSQQKKQQDTAKDYDFMNQIYAGKAKGTMSRDQAIQYANKVGDGAWDVGQKEAIVTKLYTTDIKTDPVTYMAMWEGVRNGQLQAKDLYQVFTKGRISGSDFMELSKLAFKGEGNLKSTMDMIEIQAKEKYADPIDRARFIYSVEEAKRTNPGITSDELYKKAQTLMDKDPNTGWLGFIGVKKNYQTEFSKSGEDLLAMGQVKQDLGSDVVKSIERTTLKGQSKFMPEDIKPYFQEFGDDAMKPGGRANDAIKYLNSQGLDATFSNIKKYLELTATSKGVAKK